jgi:Flp pilus assembly protein CpaB
MNQRANGRRFILIGVVIIVVVLLAALLLLSRSSGSSSPSTAVSGKTTPVVVALQTIPQNTVFRHGQPLTTFFGVKQMPTSVVPFGAYTSVAQIQSLIKSAGCQPPNIAGCVGQITTTQVIFQGIPVLSGMFSTLGQYRVTAGPSFRIPYGYVGITLSVGDDVAGSIQAGDDIDVIASYTGQALRLGINAPPQTQYILNDVRVIGVGGPPPPAGSTTTAAASGGVLYLLARYQEALVVQHLKDFGWQLSAVLRSARETDIPHFRTLPVTDRWFFVKTSNPFRQHLPY